MKHTPGPWKASKPTEYWPIVLDQNGRPICDTGIAASRNRETNQANAKLIAASPELLEALQAIEGVDDPDKVITASWTVEDWRNAKRQYDEVARKAIAKALGTGPA